MFIEEYPDLVPVELCDRIVALFEADPRKTPSIVNRGAQKAIRTGMQLNPKAHEFPEWAELLKPLEPAFRISMQSYAQKYEGLRLLIQNEPVVCLTPLIERVNPGEGFGWHYDQSAEHNVRVVAALLYLRTITQGGETVFLEQKRSIRPVAGKIALFPPHWTYTHRGVTPTSEVKYVMSYFWVYAAGTRPPPAQSSAVAEN